jgi:hypothetical protein
MANYKDDYQRYLNEMTDLFYARLQAGTVGDVSYMKPLIKDLINLNLILAEQNSFPRMINFRQQSRIGRTKDKDIKYLIKQPDPELQAIFDNFLSGI